MYVLPYDLKFITKIIILKLSYNYIFSLIIVSLNDEICACAAFRLRFVLAAWAYIGILSEKFNYFFMKKIQISSDFLLLFFGAISKKFAPNEKASVGINIIMVHASLLYSDVKLKFGGVEVDCMSNIIEDSIYFIPLSAIRAWKKILENLPLQPLEVNISENELEIKAKLPVFNF